MKILVVGGGGRESAIVTKLLQSPTHPTIYVCPGNGGMKGVRAIDSLAATDIDGIVEWCKCNSPDFAVVAPDDPLVAGLVDRLEDLHIKCFGPRANAAIIEGSKVFSKNLMKKYGIPTADYVTFDKADDALDYVKTCKIPVVVKADGLALGKGVLIALTRGEAIDAVKEIMQDKKFGASGNHVVIEEFLQGPEVSVLAFTDGKIVVPMVSSMDHKRALDGDKGLNTGGMGTVAPNPYYTDEIASECMRTIFVPTIEAMNKEGRTFKGCLFFGLMLTKDGAKVIEYNCRFGDPETQVVLPLLTSDLLTIFQEVADGNLKKEDVVFASDKSACCVVAASKGYPEHYLKGYEITLPPTDDKTRFIFAAGVKARDGKLLTNGGRVLGSVAVENDLQSAISAAYDLSNKVEFANKYTRSDIGARALEALTK